MTMMFCYNNVRYPRRRRTNPIIHSQISGSCCHQTKSVPRVIGIIIVASSTRLSLTGVRRKIGGGGSHGSHRAKSTACPMCGEIRCASSPTWPKPCVFRVFPTICAVKRLLWQGGRWTRDTFIFHEAVYCFRLTNSVVEKSSGADLKTCTTFDTWKYSYFRVNSRAARG